MSDVVTAFYDELASDFHLVYGDWEAAIERHGRIFATLIENATGHHPARVLDCACGIGTQAIGIARAGHHVVGSDISAPAIERARREGKRHATRVDFRVADMRDLSTVPGTDFDAVIAADNALPHLTSTAELNQAATSMAGKLRRGGVALVTIRDYDHLLHDRPAVQPPAFHTDNGRRRIVHQVWDWLDDRQYTFHLYLTIETAGGWECRHYTSVYRALLREELEHVLAQAGFTDLRWVMPPDSGFHQPIVMGTLQG